LENGFDRKLGFEEGGGGERGGRKGEEGDSEGEERGREGGEERGGKGWVCL